MTNARFSSSLWSTGIEQPDLSTRAQVQLAQVFCHERFRSLIQGDHVVTEVDDNGQRAQGALPWTVFGVGRTERRCRDSREPALEKIGCAGLDIMRASEG
jgi:hypothetical protein